MVAAHRASACAAVVVLFAAGCAAPVPLPGAGDVVEMEVPPEIVYGREPGSPWRVAIGRTEVTVAEFQAFCDATGRRMPAQPGGAMPSWPVVNVTWKDASDYCEWRGGRLPSHREWERAIGLHDRRLHEHWVTARGLVDTGLPDSDESRHDRIAGGLATVGTRDRDLSETGIADLWGNACEWLVDIHDDGPVAGEVPSGPAPPPRALVIDPHEVRGFRTWMNTTCPMERGTRSPAIGFRVCFDRRP